MVSAQREAVANSWKPWLAQYSARIQLEHNGDDLDVWLMRRQEKMLVTNPRFVLRQWVLEEVIKTCEGEDLEKGRAVLGKVLEVRAGCRVFL